MATLRFKEILSRMLKRNKKPKYTKPELITVNKEKLPRVGGLLRRTRLVKIKGKEFVIRENVTQEELDIAWKLIDKGIPVEESLFRRPQGIDKVMIYQSTGDPIYYLYKYRQLTGFSESDCTHVAQEYARIL